MKDFVLRSLRAIFDLFVSKPAQGATELAESVTTIVSELVQAAGSAVASQLSWASKIKIAQAIDTMRGGAGKMLPAMCAFVMVWALTPAWPLVVYLAVVFFILDLPAPSTPRENEVARATG